MAARYKILRKIADGGMAELFLATQRGAHHRCTTRACSATHWAACSCQEKRCAVQYTNSPAARARAVNCW